MADTNFIDFTNFIVQQIGQDGGIEFDTQMVDHNFKLTISLPQEEYDILEKEQILTIGKEGEKITQEQIFTFLKELKSFMGREVFDNGRSYHYGGIDEDHEKKYSITWGS